MLQQSDISKALPGGWYPGTEPGSAIPQRLRLLCVGTQQPTWVGLALQLDAEGCHDPILRWVSTGHETLTLLSSETFDCFVLQDTDDADVLSLLQAIRAADHDDPVLLLLPVPDEEVTLAAQQLHGDVIATPLGWASRVIIPSLRRALERIQLKRENHRLSVADRRRLVRDRDEAEHLLHQQRQILGELEKLALDDAMSGTPVEHTPHVGQRFPEPAGMGEQVSLPLEFDHYYQELLRTYVMMGSGNLANEINKLAELLALAGYGPRQALQLHLRRVEQLVQGLGNRSTRHVMSRADLLALELMIHLGESYQRRCQRGSASESNPVDFEIQ